MSRLPYKWRVCCAFLILLLCLSAIAASAHAEVIAAHATVVLPSTAVEARTPPATSAASFALYDPASGAFLATRDADTPRPMASTTKIMTALVVLEVMRLDTVVKVPAAAVGIEGSSIYLFVDEEITVRTLLYALLLSSANDAAAALALVTAGSIESFAEQMNRKAAELGLMNTHFVTPHGLHDDAHYSTARDMALLTAAAMENPTFAEIVATTRYTAPQIGTDATRLFLNHNRLLRTYDGAIGVKTGFTKASGRCLVSAARRDGLTLIAVTLNDPNDWRDHAALFDWGFSQYVAFAPSLPPFSLPVVGGTAESVRLVTPTLSPLTLPATHGEITCRVEAPRFLYAGFASGARIGRVVWQENGVTIAEAPLLAESGVTKENTRPSLWERIKGLFGK